ncbi:hypothetical protein EYF80_002603 [Liparis tanakae]|uniref:Uncharacterized protein n=1 Tax=Liparis tanakae TaxID=230148 RepID=A0A4Z2JDQ3_9TELE|nr:hypothetical protein EYF80_002603 [Liparis tanakae]
MSRALTRFKNIVAQSSGSQMVDTCQMLQVRKSDILHAGAAGVPFRAVGFAFTNNHVDMEWQVGVEKLTVFLVVALVPIVALRAAEDPSRLGHSPPSGRWGTWCFRAWFNVDFERAPHCNNITTTIKDWVWPSRPGKDGPNRGQGKKKKDEDTSDKATLDKDNNLTLN